MTWVGRKITRAMSNWMGNVQSSLLTHRQRSRIIIKITKTIINIPFSRICGNSELLIILHSYSVILIDI